MSTPSERSIFLEALDCETEQDRATYLDNACGTDWELRSAVEQLLEADSLPDNPLDRPVVCPAEDDSAGYRSTWLVGNSLADMTGTVIGPYRLMEQIGEGGFGLVFVAEQQQPVRRRVALKIIKPGMDSKEVIVRFEAERQALALMDHPNIASVHDAGTTDQGRPYFVMELVRGIPITDFCRQHKSSLADRLDLFTSVCEAIQHAHQKGVIHRDIKPSNVLVTLHGDKAVPKVIDFGVAKAINQRLTEKTLYSRFAGMIGTPLYMSPEQAEMSGLDVDTRSDIYSLGVLLYELLTGTTPIERTRLDSIGLLEVRRIICEEQPAKPSTRLTTTEVAASDETVAAPRASHDPRLSRAIRGDLDWIVMKAIEKDPARRYASVKELSDDIRRHLAGQPIEARPPSQLYQLQKFANRNRVALTAAGLVLLAMVAATTISLWQRSVAVAERDQKDAALKKAVELQREADAAHDDLSQFVERVKDATVLVTSGRAHADAERFDAAYADFSAAIERQPNYHSGWTERALLEVQLGLWDLAARDFERANELGAPADSAASWAVPLLYLFVGDDAAYRDSCERLLQLATEQDGPTPMPAIRSCVMSPDSPADFDILVEHALAYLNGRDSDDLRALGDTIVREFSGRFNDRDGRPPRRPPPDAPPEQRSSDGSRWNRMPRGGGPPHRHESRQIEFPRGVVLYITGLSLYRADRFEEAIEKLEAAVADSRWRHSQITLPALAMAHHRAGNGERSRELFSEASDEFDRLTQEIADSPVGSLPLPWFDWIEFQLLYRQASILLTGFAPADDPRRRAVERKALEAIGTSDSSER